MTALGPYTVGDSPATPVELDFFPIENAAAYTTVTLTLKSEAGMSLATIGPLTLDEDERVTFIWPVGSFPVAGLFTLTPKLTGPSGYTQTLGLVHVVVIAEDGWHTVVSAAEQFNNAPDLPELYELLEVAKVQVLDYAPALADGAPVPLSYRKAQLLQARNLLNAGQVNPASGDQGGDSYALSTFPMDWSVKNILRPERGLPNVG